MKKIYTENSFCKKSEITDSPYQTSQRDKEENTSHDLDEKMFGMLCITAIDNTTNASRRQESYDDRYVDLEISEKAEETNKSNTMASSEKITNNQSCFHDCKHETLR